MKFVAMFLATTCSLGCDTRVPVESDKKLEEPASESYHPIELIPGFREVEILREAKGRTTGSGWSPGPLRVIRNEDNWKFFRRSLGLQDFEIDFSKNMLLYCQLIHSTGGAYQTGFGKVGLVDGSLRVMQVVVVPEGPVTMNYPGFATYHLLEIRKHEGPILVDVVTNGKGVRHVEIPAITAAEEKEHRKKVIAEIFQSGDAGKSFHELAVNYHEILPPNLIDYLEKGRGEHMRPDLIYLLGSFHDSKALGLMGRIVKSADETQQSRWAAAGGLASLGSLEAIPDLIEAMELSQKKGEGYSSLFQEALKNLAGSDQGADPEKWRIWLDEKKKTLAK